MKYYYQYLFFCFALILLSSCGAKKNITDFSSTIALQTDTYFITKNNKKLKFDFYAPVKSKKDLPLLIYVHGGGFSGGARDDGFIKKYCIDMAKNGFAVASISYRLTMQNIGFGCSTSSLLKVKAFDEASIDISYATSYFLERQKKLNIDTNKIILIGSSAGAEAVLNLAYLKQNNILPRNFSYAGVIAMAGAITSLENITEETAIPTQLFHGVKDKLVPYHIASHHYCNKDSVGFLKLYGSRAIANKLKKLNKPYYLYTVSNGNHSWNSKPMFFNRKEMLLFINKVIVQKKNLQLEKTEKESSYTSKDI